MIETQTPEDSRTLGDSIRPLPSIIADNKTGKGRIERAALHLFSNATIDGVSTKRIAQEAGVSEGLLYKHYKSKDALARALMLAIHNKLTNMILAVDALNIPIEEKIRRITLDYCHIADADWPLFRYHILHLHHFPKLSEAPEKSPHGAAVSLLARAIEKGDITLEDPEILAPMALGVVLQVAHSKVLGAINGPLMPHADRLTEGVLAVLKLNG
jgi:AcrR family transcriptional regulator